MNRPTEIIVHCSATRPEWMLSAGMAAKVDEIRRWHLSNGWSEIGYHWIIDRDGRVLPGRAESTVGAHTKNKNTGSIGVCLIGGFGSARNDQFDDHFTPAQAIALRDLIERIKGRHPIKRVSGHNEYSSKACPGFDVRRWLDGAPPRTLAESRTMIGQATAATGTVGATAAEQIAPLLQTTADTLEPVSYLSTWLRVLFVVLTIAGIGLTVWARWDDWQRGRR